MYPVSVRKVVSAILIRLECAYGLKYVELNNRSGRTPWSTRQTAVYHKFSYGQEANSSTWVFVAIPKRTKLSLGRYVRGSSDLTALNPFETHLIILDTILANWRPYIVYLTERINEHVGDVLFAMRGFILFSLFFLTR